MKQIAEWAHVAAGVFVGLVVLCVVLVLIVFRPLARWALRK